MASKTAAAEAVLRGTTIKFWGHRKKKFFTIDFLSFFPRFRVQIILFRIWIYAATPLFVFDRHIFFLPEKKVKVFFFRRKKKVQSKRWYFTAPHELNCWHCNSRLKAFFSWKCRNFCTVFRIWTNLVLVRSQALFWKDQSKISVGNYCYSGIKVVRMPEKVFQLKILSIECRENYLNS